MKKYFAGLLTGVLAMGLALSALAITGRMTIEVDPINIQVNGQTFAPTDVNGAEVPVFAYNGTTYAPLRALAEAYGLEVGYDAATNMATVQAPDTQPAADRQTDNAQSKPGLVQTEAADYDHWSAEDETAYQEFRIAWSINRFYMNGDKAAVELSGRDIEFEAKRTDERTFASLNNNSIGNIEKFCVRRDEELRNEYNISEVKYTIEIVSGISGWTDTFEDSGWHCGYREFSQHLN